MIKKIYLSAMLLASTSLVFGQLGTTKNIGRSSDFAKLINDVSVSSTSDREANTTFILTAPSGKNITGNVNLKKIVADGKIKIVGNAGTDGSFNMSVSPGGDITGLYTSVKHKKAYKYYTDEATDNVIVKEVDINSVLCIDYKAAPEDPANAENTSRSAMPIPIFESKPGSLYVIYIDLDGETSTSDWNNGNTINAAARTWSTADVQTLWEVAAQDYLTWDVNVTTSRTVYNATPECRRKMCIVTSTTTAAPGSGGVAYINTFDDCSGNPCWVFNSGAKTAGETVSHEIGHTVGLRHDGVTGGATYYSGHADWAPIMGSSYTKNVGHWSIGEYTNANNQENDLNIIGTQNTFTARADDVPNTTTAAKALVIETNGNVLNTLNRGLINNRTDLDMFKFTTASSGNVNLTIAPFYKYPNLNVKARLLNSSGAAIVTADPTGTTTASMSATVTANSLAAGTYYLEIDGAGNGTPTAGYSDYSSIGDYYISGSVPLPSNNPVPQFTSNSAKVCAGTQVAYTDQTTNGATSWKWTFTGGTPATSTAQNPNVTYNVAGTYSVKLVSQNASGKDSITKANYITVTAIPANPSTTGASRCGAGIVNLSASGSGGTLNWYTASTGGTLVNTGTNYSPNLSTTTTYYVSQAAVSAPQKVGPVDNTINVGGYLTGSDVRGLLFDVLATCTLKTVKVYANTAGNRTIEVRQGVGGTILHLKTVNIPAGESRVTLDFVLQPGTQYHIKVAGTLVDLYRNTGGATYPYTIANLVSITETDYAATATGYYYYFYDWELIAPGCTSNRVAVTGTVNQGLTPGITGTTSICKGSSTTLTATGGTTYSWDTGATTAAITVSPSNTKTYTVTATSAGCSGVATVSVAVNNIPTPTITGTTTICSGGSTTLTASGGGTYVWNTGATTAVLNVSPNNTRDYTVTATSNGCSGSVVTTVTVNTTPATPTINQNGAVLTSSSATGNQWYRNGVLIPGATNQNYTVTQNGNYTVIVTSNGCPSSASAPLNYTSTGIAQTDNAYFFNIYPNPSDGNFNVAFNVNNKADYKLELRNTLGQIVYSEVLTDFTGSYSKQLNVVEYGKGIYMISLTSSENETIKKVIVY